MIGMRETGFLKFRFQNYGVYGLEFVEDFLVFSGHGECANNQKCNANVGGESHFMML